MTLLEQCEIWNDREEYQSIIDAIEALPKEERTPELDSELARACNNIADVGDRALFEKAAELLKPHEAYFAGDHNWNFRLAYAYYYLDQEGRALYYFKKALEARPGDADTQEMIDDCRRRLTLPLFEKNFRLRTLEAWAVFEEREEHLRGLMDRRNQEDVEETLIAECGDILETALKDVNFELGYNGEKYELILTPEGDKARLFELVYFRRHAPVSLRGQWNIRVGRQTSEGFELKAFGHQISAKDVEIWIERLDENRIKLTLFCEMLLDMFQENEDRVWWMLSVLTDQILGEIPAMTVIGEFEAVNERRYDPGAALSRLPELLKAMGISFCMEADEYLEHSYSGYELEPDRDSQEKVRTDVYIGSTRCVSLVRGFLSGESSVMDAYHQDGVAAGFFFYPLDMFTGENRAEAVMEFRDRLEAAVTARAGEDAVTFSGGATGIYCGYLDFIAWDLRLVLEAASDFFEKSGLSWASFQSFRQDVGAVCLLDQTKEEAEEEPEAAVHQETGSLLSKEDMDTLASFDEGSTGYFYRMIGYIDTFIQNGEKEGRFTRRQAQRDLQIALWYSYGCNNIDEYEYYYKAAQWMTYSEGNAKGCGMWYYRYSVALMYCGRLDEARHYAEAGIQEEPSYPWIWLQAAKLRSHFGDREGALAAVEQGLLLEPGDHEFLTLGEEIKADAGLEQMEYHWIDPRFDQMLQDGLDENEAAKMRSISCICVRPEGVKYFKELFHPIPADLKINCPYCSFHYPIRGREVELVFRMNEAGLSKLPPQWLEQQKERLDCGQWLVREIAEDQEAMLETALFGLDLGIELLYRLSDSEKYFRVSLSADGIEQGEPVKLELLQNASWEDSLIQRENGSIGPELYTEDEMSAVEAYIKEYFGDFSSVFHELVSPDIHVDICTIPPDGNRDYYTLVTMGMGAHRMNIPEELAGQGLERAELVIFLPPYWELDQEAMQDEKWYWPVRLLKSLARLPGNCDTWLGWGHTVDYREPFSENTELCAAMLISSEEAQEECLLPNKDTVCFYQVIPIYRDEMQYKQEKTAQELLEKMEGSSRIIDPYRLDVLTEAERRELQEEESGELLMDNGKWHLECLREKELPVQELAAFNHMAIYLRWCIEHHMMRGEFLHMASAWVKGILTDPEHTDLRVFIRDELEGVLTGDIFNEQGEAFAEYYYSDRSAPYFPSDIDDYAFGYFGEERYYAEEFKDEAYLFIPSNEKYYQEMAKVIKKRWDGWRPAPRDQEPTPVARALMRYLDCECRYFPPLADDDPITADYGYAARRGRKDGYVPVLIRADELLLKCLIMNSDPDSGEAADGSFDLQKVKEYRERILSLPVKDGKKLLQLPDEMKETVREYGIDWESIIMGNMEGGEENNSFLSYWENGTNRTAPLILAMIPVKNPWEIFAYLPFGGWNECPGTEELMAAAKYWYEQYGAVPAAVTHDELEFAVPAPVPKERAAKLAQEQYCFCPDAADEGTIGSLADGLRRSGMWYFWWD